MSNARRTIAALLSAAVVVLLAGCLVPDNSYLMELNRHGRWRTVQRIGSDMLAHRSNFTPRQRCETYFHVIYAETRLGRRGEAVKMMARYDAACREGNLDRQVRWLDREIAKLKDELGLLDHVQHTLVAALEANRGMGRQGAPPQGR